MIDIPGELWSLFARSTEITVVHMSTGVGTPPMECCKVTCTFGRMRTLAFKMWDQNCVIADEDYGIAE